MDIKALRYFIEVVRRQSFTRAADALFVTQPTISKMVKHLEEELGVPLIIREGRSFQLSDAGKVAYERGQDVLAAMSRLKTELSDLSALTRGELIVGLPPMVGGAFFAPVVSSFRAHYPNVELKMVEYGARSIESNIRSGQLEIGVAVLPVDRQVFNTFSFVRDRLCLVAPDQSRWHGQRNIKIADIADEPIVFYPEDFSLSTLVSQGFRRLGKTIHIAGRSAHWDFIAAMVEARLGIALLPESVAARLYGRPFDVIPLDEKEIIWHLALIWQKDVYLSHAARAWIQMSRDMLGSLE